VHMRLSASRAHSTCYSTGPDHWKDASKMDHWEAALKTIENEEIRKFYADELAHGQMNYLRRRQLRYSINGRYLFYLHARRGVLAVYVWQLARFPDDEKFWTDRLGKDCDAEPVKGGSALRFYLRSGEACRSFKDAIEKPLKSVDFGDNEVEEDEVEGLSTN
jgi:hypothetical protein